MNETLRPTWRMEGRKPGLPSILMTEQRGLLKGLEDSENPAGEVETFCSNLENRVNVLFIPPCSNETIKALFDGIKTLKAVEIIDYDINRLEIWRQNVGNLTKKITVNSITDLSNVESQIYDIVQTRHLNDGCLGRCAFYSPRRFRRFDSHFIDLTKKAVLTSQQMLISSLIHKSTRNWHKTLNFFLNLSIRKNNVFTKTTYSCPMIIVGAGPSLDETVDSLKKWKDKALIISTTSSLGTLLQHDIIPDLLVFLEDRHISFMKDINRHLDITRGIPMVTYLEASHVMIRHYLGPVAFVANEDSLGGRFFSLPNINSGSCVGHVAFHLAEYLKASKIILMGFDLSFTETPASSGREEKVYTNGVNDEYLPERNISYVEVPGQDGKWVRTELGMKGFINYFESAIKTCPVPVYNTSKNGALIKGAKLTTLDECLLNDDNVEKISPIRSDLLNSFDNEQIMTDRLQSQLHDISSKLSVIKKEIDEMTDKSVKNPFVIFDFDKEPFPTILSCCSSILMFEFVETLNSTDSLSMDKFIRQLSDIHNELTMGVRCLQIFLSLRQFKPSTKGNVLFLGENSEIMKQLKNLYDEEQICSFSESDDFTAIWEIILEKKISVIVAVDGDIFPDAWTAPNIKCVDVKTTFSPVTHERSLWLPGYYVACLYEKNISEWRNFLPKDIDCGFLNDILRGMDLRNNCSTISCEKL